MTDPVRDDFKAALSIIKKLRAGGHVALLAGGCVRDRLLGEIPKDYDIATDAKPEQVLAMFPRARRVGVKFGVVLVRRYGCDMEVATFRADGPYSDGRHPDHVQFGTEREDALRRDFTINGLFFDPVEDRIIDYVEGQKDLDARTLRTIGKPEKRFREDHLRMLRAVRFAARFGLKIDPTTRTEIQRLAAKLETISAERIGQELKAILTAPTREIGWELLEKTGLRNHLAPGWMTKPHEDARIRTRLADLPKRAISVPLALSAVLVDRTPHQADRVSRALRLSNRQWKAVTWLVESLPIVRQGSSLDIADLKTLMAQSHWNDLLTLLHADLTVSEVGMEAWGTLQQRSAKIAPEEIAPTPLITGNDMVGRGFPPGPELGRLLDAIYRAQLNEEISTREEAWSLLTKLTKSQRP